MTPTLEHTWPSVCTKTGKAAPHWSSACLPLQGEERPVELKFLLGIDTIVSAHMTLAKASSTEKQQSILPRRRQANVCKHCCNLLQYWSVFCHFWDKKRPHCCGISHRSTVLQPSHKTSSRPCPHHDHSSHSAHASRIIIRGFLFL